MDRTLAHLTKIYSDDVTTGILATGKNMLVQLKLISLTMDSQTLGT